MKTQISAIEAIKLIESKEYTQIKFSFIYCVILGCYVKSCSIDDKYYLMRNDAELIEARYLEA